MPALYAFDRYMPCGNGAMSECACEIRAPRFCEADLFAGELEMHAMTDPETLRAGLLKYFVSRAEVAPQADPWCIFATIFVDYAPMKLKFHIFGDKTSAQAVASQVSGGDVVRFHKMFESVMAHMRLNGVQVTSGTKKSSELSGFELMDHDFDESDFDDVEEETWGESAEAVLNEAAYAACTQYCGWTQRWWARPTGAS
eukprot:gnl/TRDRNA2_/TRDRNA2_174691_c0_seq2.p1 gnl/TRDRNA2_/TRDRNA2_174691_c0~~gnl/TRDRNA2_/TRDRNA2_174691_c0_seq2.p1  ORF type:complete len:199 (+),score=45.59 gnl/TRDRNA2_/TRDRNA2_174691_c0_seq2:70-666(+)